MTKLLMPRFQVSKVAVLCFLLVLAVIAALPGYFTGNWSWAKPLPVANLKRLNSMINTGVTLPGWQTKEQRTQPIGGHKWSYQELQRDDDQKPVKLLLLPQKTDKAQPEVEWMDINGLEGWKTDSERRLQFTVQPLGSVTSSATPLSSSPSDRQEATGSLSTPIASQDRDKQVKVEARFFRAWNQRQTFAVLQWYARPDGGNPEPSHWFFADQIAQWHRRRVPWVAVSIHIPIQPLGDIETARAQAESLGQSVQAALMADSLSSVIGY